MKLFASVIVAMLTPLALGQSLADIPTCAQSCVSTSLSSTGCSSLDIKCICSASAFISNISCCIKTACSVDDQAKTIKFASDICASAGVTLPTDINAACGAASGSSSISAPQSSPTASSLSSAPGSVGTSLAATATSKPKSTITSEATAKPAIGTGAAAQFVASGLGLVGAAAAALALL